MKKLSLLSAFAALLIGATSQAQISQNNNNSPPFGAPFVGWNGTVGPARDLDINNKFNRPINLYTNGVQSFATYTVQHRIKTLPKTSTLAH